MLSEIVNESWALKVKIRGTLTCTHNVTMVTSNVKKINQ